VFDVYSGEERVVDDDLKVSFTCYIEWSNAFHDKGTSPDFNRYI